MEIGTWMLGILLALLIALSGCSVKLEFGYHGETGKNDRTFTVDKAEVRK